MSTYRSSSASPSTSRKAVKASATASASSSSRPRSDPYYGHEETSVLCAKFITSLFQCPSIPSNVAPGAPSPTLGHFVGYALHRTRLPSVVTFAALLLLQRLKIRFPAARGSSGHRLFISAFMIASKVICDDTYSNQSWGIVAQKMFALKEINQMEREMCGYLEWNLNVAAEELVDFESRVRSEHGIKPTRVYSTPTDVPMVYPTVHAYPTPDATPEVSVSRPIRPVPSPYKYRPTTTFPSPPSSPYDSHSPQPPHFESANSSLTSSPASDDCKTPSPVAVIASQPRSSKPTSVDMSRAFDTSRFRHQLSYPIGAW